MKALEKDRTRRYDTANSFAADILRHLNNEPVLAGPPSVTYKLRKFVRRNRLSMTAGGAVAAALILGTTFATVGFLKATDARNAADAARDGEYRARISAQEARDRESALRRASDHKAFVLSLERGLDLSQNGQIKRGMLWLARALKIAPTEEAALKRLIRRNLSALGNEVHPLVGVLSHPSSVGAVAFSPNGEWGVAGTRRDGTWLWDWMAAEQIRNPFGNKLHVHSVAFDPTGSLILTAAYDGTAILWDSNTGKSIHTFKHDKEVEVADFFRDGSNILTTSRDRTLRVWDAGSGLPRNDPVKIENWIHDAAISSDGNVVITADWQGNSYLWNVLTGEKFDVPFAHGSSVSAVDISPDGATVLTAGGSAAQLWDLASRKPTGPRIEHLGTIHHARFSPNGHHVVTASYDNTGRLWDVLTGEPIGTSFEHDGPLEDAAFSPVRSLVVTGGHDGIARIWDIGRVKPAREPFRDSAPVNAVAITPDGTRVVFAGTNGVLELWAAHTHQHIRSIPLKIGVIYSIAIRRRLAHCVGKLGQDCASV